MIDFKRCLNSQMLEKATEEDFLEKQGFDVRNPSDCFWHHNFAHRGLHDISNSIPENSLLASVALVWAVSLSGGVVLYLRL